MAIFQQIGLNGTAVFQFGIFVFTLLFVAQYTFKHYLSALAEREKQTVGAQDLSLEIQKDTQELQKQYEHKARDLNNEVKVVFDTYREQANKDSLQILSAARAESQKLLEQTKSKLEAELSQATQAMKQEIPTLAQAVVSKLLSTSGQAR